MRGSVGLLHGHLALRGHGGKVFEKVEELEEDRFLILSTLEELFSEFVVVWICQIIQIKLHL